MEKEKVISRKLTTYQYYEALQIEYISAVLRTKIYPKVKDKTYWSKVAEGKRVTIQEISERNGSLPSIFDDSDLSISLNRRVFGDEGFPHFSYKDQEQELSQSYYDHLYYFYKGAEVRFRTQTGGELLVGTVVSYKVFDKTVVVQSTSLTQPISISTSICTRIL